MFSWFRRKQVDPAATAPATAPASAPGNGGGGRAMAGSPPQSPSRPGENPANPGLAPRGRVKLADGRRQWAEEFDCVQLLAGLLADNGHQPRVEGDVIIEGSTQLSLRPLMAAVEAIPGKGIQTVTTIEVKHPAVIPSAVFEFQHSTGEDVRGSIGAGFDQWCKTDLVTLADVIRPEPKQCTLMTMELPAKGDRPAMKRRIVLGPVAHLQQHPPDPADGPEEHPFCPCCLLTQSMKAFMPLIESPGLFALRLFAMRDADDKPGADCRVNGEDFDDGKAHLERYATTWPGRGFEFRRQYVVIQDAT